MCLQTDQAQWKVKVKGQSLHIGIVWFEEEFIYTIKKIFLLIV